MTFEEWYFKNETDINPTAEEAYTAGQESMRPLVEKMRKLAEMAMCARCWADMESTLQTAIAEADKFLGEK